MLSSKVLIVQHTPAEDAGVLANELRYNSIPLFNTAELTRERKYHLTHPLISLSYSLEVRNRFTRSPVTRI